MSDNGWIKSYRKMKDSGIMRNPQLFTFWHWCLYSAAFKKHKVTVGLQEVELESGQFIFSRNMAMTELGLSEQTVRTILNTLKTNQQINIKSTNKFSIITIVNWDSYQGRDMVSQPATNQQTNRQLTSKPIIPIIEEYKEDKECKEVNTNTRAREGKPKPAPKTLPKIKFADDVLLTEQEHAALTAEYGDKSASEMIEILSNYKGSKGKTYKSDYKAIRSWVVNAHKERCNKNTTSPKTGNNPFLKMVTNDMRGADGNRRS